ncbi:MAG TPA: hypothetical protein VGO58_10375 [Chitinophagaceae bacterium]|nr:hypothetical protein [Chitinophagaceae bacterium]
MVVLAIHLVGELISNKRKNNKAGEAEVMNEKIRHPAEFDLR